MNCWNRFEKASFLAFWTSAGNVIRGLCLQKSAWILGASDERTWLSLNSGEGVKTCSSREQSVALKINANISLRVRFGVITPELSSSCKKCYRLKWHKVAKTGWNGGRLSWRQSKRSDCNVLRYAVPGVTLKFHRRRIMIIYSIGRFWPSWFFWFWSQS